jgi:hypothetical protein
MNPPGLKPEIIRSSENDSSSLSLRSIIRKSALLNVTIVLTSLPVLLFAGGPKAVVPALELMAGISLLIWSLTFALFSAVSVARLFGTPAPSKRKSDPLRPATDAGVTDRWLDGPV